MNVIQVNNTINFTIVNYGLQGSVFEMRQMRLSDLNLCNAFSAPSQLWQQNVKLAQNFYASCSINLPEYIERHPVTRFSSIHLNYWDNQANFLETVPVLIRNAFAGNTVSRENSK